MDLREYNNEVQVELKSFDKKLIKLNKNDFLPRYNSIIVTITNNSSECIEFLYLTVIRTGLKASEHNFDVIPIKTYDLKPKSQGKYKLLAFDPFNEKFNEIRIKLTNQIEFNNRTKSEKLVGNSDKYSKRINKQWFNIF